MRLFRREWIFPALALAFITTSAHATRDELSAQAAADLHCDSVSLARSGPNEFLATGCGRERTYTCDDSDVCTSTDANASQTTSATVSDPDADDAAADAIASVITDMACACASAGLASHGSHHSSSSRHHAHQR